MSVTEGDTEKNKANSSPKLQTGSELKAHTMTDKDEVWG